MGDELEWLPGGRPVRVRGPASARPAGRADRPRLAGRDQPGGRPSHRDPPRPRARRPGIPRAVADPLGRGRRVGRARPAVSGTGAATSSTWGRPRSRASCRSSSATSRAAGSPRLGQLLAGRAGRRGPRPAVRPPRREPAGDPRRRPGAPAVGRAAIAAAIARRSIASAACDRPTRSIACARPWRSSASTPWTERRLAALVGLAVDAARARPRRPGRHREPWSSCRSGPRRTVRVLGEYRGRSRGPGPPRPRPAARGPSATVGDPPRPPRGRAPRPGQRRPGRRASSSGSRHRARSSPMPAPWPSRATSPGSARASGGSRRSWPRRSGPAA